MMLFDLLRTPSSFEGQPVAFARNQAGHAGVGMLLAWALGAWWPVALGYAAWEIYKERFPDAQGVLLETAHPAKFLPVMEPLVGEFPVPDRLSALMGIEKVTTSLSSGFEEFKEYLMSRS